MPYGRRVRSLRARAFLLLGILLLALALGVREVTSALDDAADAAALADDSIIPIQLGTSDLRSAALNQETGLQGYLLGRQELLLVPYTAGGAAADDQLASLATRAARTDWDAVPGVDGPEVDRQIDAVAARLQEWRTRYAEPQIAATRSGLVVSQGEATAASAAFAAVRASINDLDEATDVAFAAAQDERSGALAVLQQALVAAVAVLLVAVAALAWLTRRWMLRPVRQLSTQMAEVAGGALDRPLTPSGPAEVAAMGANAERMRARLLHDVDEAVRAREAIAQQSPAVALLRAELGHRTAPTAPGWDIAGSVVPAEGALAGDWWDVLPRPDGSRVLVQADLAGHGVPAGLAAVRLRDLLGALLADGRPPAEALARVSERFAGESLATVLLVELPEAADAVRWISAGHPSAWLCAPDGTAVELAATGPLLSAFGGRWATRVAAFPIGGVLVCPTDGATESRDPSGDPLGPQGLRALAAQAAAEPAPSTELVDRLQAAIRLHTGDRSPDDVTVVVAQRT
jgi:serine phosphatase RsbU (regulator of sigma subunit)/CHASE3 domain sensor protein